MKSLIGLCGPQGCGKTTLARELADNHQFSRTRFASGLKAMLASFLLLQGADNDTIWRMLDGDLKQTTSDYLSGQTPRHAMQTLGTEWRDMIHRDLWLNAWEKSVLAYPSDASIVVDDMRFLHEAERVRKLGGTIIIISRPGFGPGEHLSEREYLQIQADAIVMNDARPMDMIRQIERIWKGKSDGQ